MSDVHRLHILVPLYTAFMTAEQGEKPESRPARESEGISWLMMLVWIGFAFAIAGIIAYWLVRPFFHRP